MTDKIPLATAQPCFLCQQRQGDYPLVVMYQDKRIRLLHDPINHDDKRDADEATWDYVPPDGYEPPLVCHQCLYLANEKSYYPQPGDQNITELRPGCLYKHPWLKDVENTVYDAVRLGRFDPYKGDTLIVDEIRLARVSRHKDSHISGSDIRWSWMIVYYAHGIPLYATCVGDDEQLALHAAAYKLVKLQEGAMWYEAQQENKSKAAECPACGGPARVRGYVGGGDGEPSTGMVIECMLGDCKPKPGPDGEPGEKAFHVVSMLEGILHVEDGEYDPEIHKAAWNSSRGQQMRHEAGEDLDKAKKLKEQLGKTCQKPTKELVEQDALSDFGGDTADLVRKMLGGDVPDGIPYVAGVAGSAPVVLEVHDDAEEGMSAKVVALPPPGRGTPVDASDLPVYHPPEAPPLDKPSEAETRLISSRPKEEVTDAGVKVVDRRKYLLEDDE